MAEYSFKAAAVSALGISRETGQALNADCLLQEDGDCGGEIHAKIGKKLLTGTLEICIQTDVGAYFSHNENLLQNYSMLKIA